MSEQRITKGSAACLACARLESGYPDDVREGRCLCGRWPTDPERATEALDRYARASEQRMSVSEMLLELSRDWLLRLESSVVNGERVLWSLALARRGTGAAPSHDYYGYDLGRVASAAHAGEPSGRVE